MEIKLRTPCVGICSTIYGDEICRGCVRTYQEIIHWNSFSDEAKQATLDRLEKQTHQIVKKYIDITDQNKLTEKLHKHNIKYRSHFHPLCWAHTLLREGADKINKVENFGLTIKNAYSHLALTKLVELIDDEIYELALTEYGIEA